MSRVTNEDRRFSILYSSFSAVFVCNSEFSLGSCELFKVLEEVVVDIVEDSVFSVFRKVIKVE